MDDQQEPQAQVRPALADLVLTSTLSVPQAQCLNDSRMCWISGGGCVCKTLRQVAEYLDSKGVAPKYNGRWAPRSVGDILRNESLHGVYRLNGKILLRHEGVISKERWDTLQAKLDANPKRRGPTRNDPLMLTDLLYCDTCGQIMHARRTLGTVKKDGSRSVWTYYRCDGTPRNPSTCRNTVRADFMESWVDQWLDKAPLIDDEIRRPGSKASLIRSSEHS